MQLIQEIERMRKIMGLTPYTTVHNGLIKEQAEGTEGWIKKAIDDLEDEIYEDGDD